MSCKRTLFSLGAALTLLASTTALTATSAMAQTSKPNIMFIMGDDIGWMQVGAYHRGLGLGETPNIDRIANEGALFTDYLAMQSCTSGRTPFSPACIRCAPA